MLRRQPAEMLRNSTKNGSRTPSIISMIVSKSIWNELLLWLELLEIWSVKLPIESVQRGLTVMNIQAHATVPIIRAILYWNILQFRKSAPLYRRRNIINDIRHTSSKTRLAICINWTGCSESIFTRSHKRYKMPPIPNKIIWNLDEWLPCADPHSLCCGNSTLPLFT